MGAQGRLLLHRLAHPTACDTAHCALKHINPTIKSSHAHQSLPPPPPPPPPPYYLPDLDVIPTAHFGLTWVGIYNPIPRVCYTTVTRLHFLTNHKCNPTAPPPITQGMPSEGLGLLERSIAALFSAAADFHGPSLELYAALNPARITAVVRLLLQVRAGEGGAGHARRRGWGGLLDSFPGSRGGGYEVPGVRCA